MKMTKKIKNRNQHKKRFLNKKNNLNYIISSGVNNKIIGVINLKNLKIKYPFLKTMEYLENEMIKTFKNQR